MIGAIRETGPNWAEALTGVATAVLVFGVFLAYWTLRDARASRKAQVLAELIRRWDDPQMLRSLTLGRIYGPDGFLDLVNVLYDPTTPAATPDDVRAWYRVTLYPNLIETIGVYLSEDLISPELVYENWGANIIIAWREWRDATTRIRVLQREPNLWKWFQVTADEMYAHLLWERYRIPRDWRDRLRLWWWDFLAS